MKGSDKPDILVGRWREDERTVNLARRKAKDAQVHPRARQAVSHVRPAVQEEVDRPNEALRAKQAVVNVRATLQEQIDRLKAENEAPRAKQAVANVRATLQEQIDRLKLENERLRKQRKAPKAKPRVGRVRSKKQKRKRDLHPKPTVISTPMGGQPRFRR